IAVAHGMVNVKKILDEIQEAKDQGLPAPYDFIEIMACYGGCLGGGGQPYSVKNADETKALRSRGLYTDDKNSKVRCSHQNPMIIKMYEEYIGPPLSERAHHLLHTHYEQKKIIRKKSEL
ncbi:MAG: iron hydrogenase small subunit, partial [Gammaproteobacteria bacterium]